MITTIKTMLKTSVLGILVGLSAMATPLHAVNLLHAYVDSLKQKINPVRPDFCLKAQITTLEHVAKLNETVVPHCYDYQLKQLEFLTPSFVELLNNKFAPASSFGTLGLIEMLATPVTPDNGHELILRTTCIKYLSDILTQDLRDLLRSKFIILNARAQNVFTQNTLQQWLRLEDPSQTAPEPSILKALAPLAVSVGCMAISSWYGLPWWQSTPLHIGSSTATNRLCRQDPSHILKQVRYNDTQNAMNGLLVKLHETINEIKQFFPPELAEVLLPSLQMPDTTSPSWQTIVEIMETLKTVGRIDACLALANVVAEGSALPANLVPNAPQEIALKNLWHISTHAPGPEDATWEPLNMRFDATKHNVASVFLNNLVLSRALGIVIKSEPKDTDQICVMPNMNLSDLAVVTCCNYKQNGKLEFIFGIRI